MINNYYTLNALVDEIRDDLRSSAIEACYTRIDHTLEIIVEKQGAQPKVMVVSCKPRANFLFLRSAPHRHTGANVLRSAVGASVLSVEVIRNERTIVFGLSHANSLVVNLFGTHANVYLVDAGGEVADAFLKKDKKLVIPQTDHDREGLSVDTGTFLTGFKSAIGSPSQRLTSLLPPFTGELGVEAFYRVGGDDLVRNAKDKETILDDNSVAALLKVVSRTHVELCRPAPRIYYDGDDPILMSIIEMRHLAAFREERYESVNSCVADYSAVAEKRKTYVETKNVVVERFLKRREELAKTIGKIEKDMSGNRENKYRTYGDNIMAHLGEIGKGAENFLADGGHQKVKLDPRLNAVQNAQAYYEKAKKARESYRQAVARRDELKQTLEKIESELEKVKSDTDGTRVSSITRKEKAREEAQTPFREFETNGYRIYVGKDAANNDELTFGFAKPNDVFLHARGVSGSHVIIRNSSREYPQRPVLEFAARIAAHYSKARTSGIVPVTYTMRKFVRKAKGRPGAVLVDREEVIFVKPGIPQAKP